VCGGLISVAHIKLAVIIVVVALLHARRLRGSARRGNDHRADHAPNARPGDTICPHANEREHMADVPSVRDTIHALAPSTLRAKYSQVPVSQY